MKSINVILYWVIVMVTAYRLVVMTMKRRYRLIQKRRKYGWPDNQKYFQEKKEDVEDDGQLLYQRLVVDEDTLLYRVLETSQIDSFPKIDADVKVSMLGVIPVSQTVIVGNKDGNPIDQTLKLDSPNLIKGLAALLPKTVKEKGWML